MRALVTLSAVVAIAFPVAATPPPPPPPPSGYYGPLLICRDGVAIRVAADEAWATPDNAVRSPRASVFVESFLYQDSQYADIVHPRGSVTVAGLGTLRRILQTSRNSDSREIQYLVETGDRYAPVKALRSAAFDGSDADLAVLARVSAGEAARTLCAAVPPELQPTPAREDPLAYWYQRAPRDGPTLACWNALALPLRAGERVRVPWGATAADQTSVTIETDAGRLAISGSVAPPAGPLLTSGAYRLDWAVLAVERPESYGAVVAAARPPAIIPAEPLLRITVTGAMTRAAAAELVDRVRARTPQDRCAQ